MDKSEKTGERIAKVLARRGVASRRAAEAMIEAGRVAVNGKLITSPALNVGPKDRIVVDGKPLAEAEPARLWLYHKPLGLVTTEKDERGRPTVFAALPPELGRVISVGRLDINSEGLLLLTNDGGIKRRLELPSTGWLRKYRVRVNGMPGEAVLEPLRKGITVDGERFLPMEVDFDRQQGSNAWLTIGIREGRNREVRRAMEAVGLTVNRLIRVSYGPFRLGDLRPGAIEEVRAKVLRDQLGTTTVKGWAETGKPRAARPGAEERGPSAKSGSAARKPTGKTGPKPAGKRAGPFAGKAGGRADGMPGAAAKAGGRPAGKSAPAAANRSPGGAAARPAGAKRGPARGGPAGRGSGPARPPRKPSR